MPFRWVLARPEDGEAVERLTAELRVPTAIARLLSLRGITSFDRAASFFRPELTKLHPPAGLKDMDRAVDRLVRAIHDRERVLVYGDYDVDGTTATAIMYLFLKKMKVDVHYYIPSRHKEGYGISEDGLKSAIEMGAKLIVSVDCGITAVEEAAYVKAKGMDLIICDHHVAGDTLPDAVAVLDPKRPDCTYPFDGLSGAGVGYKLVQATLDRLGLPADEAYEYLDLVAVSIASDIVPIIDENRILMREGLRRLNENPRVGIRALLELIRMEPGKISTNHIVFSLGPRINAAGRMGEADKAVQLLIAESEEEAKAAAAELEKVNMDRRDIDKKTLESAQRKIETEIDLDTTACMVLHEPDWHLGVIGIVASRLVDQHCRPVVMLSTVDGKIKGSARSIRGFNIYDALKQCEDLLLQFGGHEFAAGLTMSTEVLPEFRRRLCAISTDCLCQEQFEPEIRIDAPIRLSEIDARFWNLLNQFEPFGPCNPKPVFASDNVQVVGAPTIVGKQGHLKLKFTQEGSEYAFDAIGFKMHDQLARLREHGGRPVSIAFTLEENCWTDRFKTEHRELQLQLKDIRYEATDAVLV